jgi:hypothetical protein
MEKKMYGMNNIKYEYLLPLTRIETLGLLVASTVMTELILFPGTFIVFA